MAIKKHLEQYFLILSGTLFLALGLRLFLVPFKISPGGVSTISTVLFYLFRVPLSFTTLIINGILFPLGIKFLGKTGVLKTIFGVLTSSLFLALFENFTLPYGDILAASITGGVLMGAGVGLSVRQEASTGGSDFAALILNRLFPHISVSHFILLIDFIIIAASGFIFKSFSVSFYSALSLIISMKTTDLILSFGDAAKSVFILSEKAREISSAIHTHFERGTTGISARGMYREKEGLMLLSVVSPKELPSLIHFIRAIDSSAFLVIFDAREVLGEGFKSGTSYDKIHQSKKRSRLK